MISTDDVFTGFRLQDWQRLQWHKDTRYYEVQLHQDLWGDWLLTRRWGRRSARSGQSRAMPCASYEHGLALLEKIVQRRQKRGYTLISEASEPRSSPQYSK